MGGTSKFLWPSQNIRTLCLYERSYLVVVHFDLRGQEVEVGHHRGLRVDHHLLGQGGGHPPAPLAPAATPICWLTSGLVANCVVGKVIYYGVLTTVRMHGTKDSRVAWTTNFSNNFSLFQLEKTQQFLQKMLPYLVSFQRIPLGKITYKNKISNQCFTF